MKAEESIDPVRISQILADRIPLIMVDIEEPIAKAMAIIHDGLEQGFRNGDGGIDSEKLDEAIGVFSNVSRVLGMARNVLHRTREQLDCEHDWSDQRLTIYVGINKCRKCNLSIEKTYR
jgi:hypothetical protein